MRFAGLRAITVGTLEANDVDNTLPPCRGASSNPAFCSLRMFNWAIFRSALCADQLWQLVGNRAESFSPKGCWSTVDEFNEFFRTLTVRTPGLFDRLDQRTKSPDAHSKSPYRNALF
jgi:hypothetical protein